MVHLTLLSNEGGFSNENLYITYYWSFCNWFGDIVTAMELKMSSKVCCPKDHYIVSIWFSKILRKTLKPEKPFGFQNPWAPEAHTAAFSNTQYIWAWDNHSNPWSFRDLAQRGFENNNLWFPIRKIDDHLTFQNKTKIKFANTDYSTKKNRKCRKTIYNLTY